MDNNLYKKYIESNIKEDPNDNQLESTLKDLARAQDDENSPYNAQNLIGMGGEINSIRNLAQQYMNMKNLGKVLNDVKNIKINPDFSKEIAKAYENLQHDPNNPIVKNAYDKLIKETMDQYDLIKSTGLDITPIKSNMENPYKSSKDMIKDIEKGHLYYYPTEQGFGTKNMISDNPLLRGTGEKIKGENTVANDMFRIVHDYFGHAKEGTGFGPLGEEKAWRQHMQMYSPEAQKALTSETRGQNSWVNFGPYGETNRINPANTIYADQKVGILPDWTRETDPEKFKDIIDMIKGKK